MQSDRVLLNLGCGQTAPPNWQNYDSSLNAQLQRMPPLRWLLRKLGATTFDANNIRFIDLNYPWRFRSATADVVYASHLFEHLKGAAAKLFLSEAFRILKTRGTLRLVVPDLYTLAKKYIHDFESRDAQAAAAFLEPLNLHLEGVYRDERNFLLKALHWFQNYPLQHKYMYDWLSLEKILAESGFKGIRRSGYGESLYIPEIGQVENSQEGVSSLYVEAIKA